MNEEIQTTEAIIIYIYQILKCIQFNQLFVSGHLDGTVDKIDMNDLSAN